MIASHTTNIPRQAITDAPHIHLHALSEPPTWALALPSLAALAAKAFLQLAALLWLMLARLPRPRAILLQNPPAIPTLLVCLLAAARHCAALIVDWHNLAYTILALKYGRHAWLISLARNYEKLLGRWAAGHFTVTSAMQVQRWGGGGGARGIRPRIRGHITYLLSVQRRIVVICGMSF